MVDKCCKSCESDVCADLDVSDAATTASPQGAFRYYVNISLTCLATVYNGTLHAVRLNFVWLCIRTYYTIEYIVEKITFKCQC